MALLIAPPGVLYSPTRPPPALAALHSLRRSLQRLERITGGDWGRLGARTTDLELYRIYRTVVPIRVIRVRGPSVRGMYIGATHRAT